MEHAEDPLSIEEKKAQFREAAITHRHLSQTHKVIVRAIREPAGFVCLLVYGPTGVGKTKMIEIIAEQVLKEILGTALSPPFSGPLPSNGWTPTPILMIKIDPPDKGTFNRASFYRTLLTKMGEPTYQQRMHVDIHAETNSPKRRPLRGKAALSNDIPELREATQDAMYRHGVRVVFLDEAHHMMYAGEGAQGSTLQEQLEWLKSLSGSNSVLYVLVGTYDLLSFGRLSGQLARRSQPIHFPRYQLQREEDCIEFQAALLTLLKKVPLRCDAETFVRLYWLYFYECSIGCVGVLKDWLLRAVSAALDEGHDMLSLDWIQDHAPLVDIYRQMAVDATEGEQKLNHTASNRKHIWRLLQGGELIGPVPPLPPRGDQPPVVTEVSDAAIPSLPLEQTNQLEIAPQDPPPPVVKKTRTRKKPKAEEPVQDPGTPSTVDAQPVVTPKRPGRSRKKTTESEDQIAPSFLTASSVHIGEESSTLIDVLEGSAVSSQAEATIVPKRSRRPGERKPKRDRVGNSSSA
jgi:hypothetical protein